jgi:HEAT repeat protein
VEQELLAVLAGGTPSMRREIIWMLSEIGDDAAITPLAALLADPQLREDARCALTRLPGRRATSALKAALAEAPEDFRFALADSLRARGEKVSGHPSRKLVPTRPPLGNAPERKTASAQPS